MAGQVTYGAASAQIGGETVQDGPAVSFPDAEPAVAADHRAHVGEESLDRGVDRARTELDRPTGDPPDLVHDRVAVLRPVAQADEDEQGRFGEPSELRDLPFHQAPILTIVDISIGDIYATTGSVSSPLSDRTTVLVGRRAA